MQVHRSKGVTTLKLTKREQDALKAAFSLTDYIRQLPGIDETIAEPSRTSALALITLINVVDPVEVDPKITSITTPPEIIEAGHKLMAKKEKAAS